MTHIVPQTSLIGRHTGDTSRVKLMAVESLSKAMSLSWVSFEYPACMKIFATLCLDSVVSRCPNLCLPTSTSKMEGLFRCLILQTSTAAKVFYRNNANHYCQNLSTLSFNNSLTEIKTITSYRCANRKTGECFTEIKMIEGTFIMKYNPLLNELRFSKRKHSLPISKKQQ